MHARERHWRLPSVAETPALSVAEVSDGSSDLHKRFRPSEKIPKNTRKPCKTAQAVA
ncbi:hypothetical protein [Neisseria chenwenguii]|uniref:hypothetical protein n=1 Tax=Neisseria chenwenguii TaxID=1853278 RepID=UPI0012FD19CC|nr:hypothetical protein [Neisseria chenwenguii]